MVVFRKLYRTTWSYQELYRNESVSVIGHIGRRQCVPHGRTRDSEASLTISSFWRAVLPDRHVL